MTVKYIDIVHHSHTDFGFTDHPLKARTLQKNYVGMALDIIEETANDPSGERFCWTAETLIPVYDWWNGNSAKLRRRLLHAIESGRFETAGMPFNVTSFLDEQEWDEVFHWIPEKLWEQLRPIVCMQNDVNGFPTAAGMRAIKRGLRYLWIGPNTYNAVPPFAAPFAFHWKMPDGNRLFVWINSGYCDGYFIFNENWRQGPIPAASDLRYRMPEQGEVWCADEKSILKAHERCRRYLERLEGTDGGAEMQGEDRDGFTRCMMHGGYINERLLVSVTGQWRMDNDPPFKPIADFVREWNRLELKPELRLTTASNAMRDLEKEIGGKIPEYSGEWTDWWANGTASSPVEVAISRKAKRTLAAIQSPLFIKSAEKEQDKTNDILRNLCLYDEHSYGSWDSVAFPFSTAARSAAAEKSILCCRAYNGAMDLLAEKVRKSDDSAGDGIFVMNPSALSVSDWAELPANCLRGEYAAIRNTSDGTISELIFKPGSDLFKKPEDPRHFSPENISHTFSDQTPRQKVEFWTGEIKPYTKIRFELCEKNKEAAWAEKITTGEKHDLDPFIIIKDSSGWPGIIRWRDCDVPLYSGAFGEFVSCTPRGFAPRWITKDIFNTDDPNERMKKRKESLEFKGAEYADEPRCEKTPFTDIYEQTFNHPSLLYGIRKLTIYKNEPRVKLQIKIYRKSSMDPEIFYIRFDIPCEGVIPWTSNGGNPFRPEIDQLPGSCKDYYAIDSWVHYPTKNGNWIWISEDAPLITFEKPNAFARLEKLPEKTNRIFSMVFDNSWDTNFACDSHGSMEFGYDLVWKKEIESGHRDALSMGLSQEPLVMVKSRNKREATRP